MKATLFPSNNFIQSIEDYFSKKNFHMFELGERRKNRFLSIEELWDFLESEATILSKESRITFPRRIFICSNLANKEKIDFYRWRNFEIFLKATLFPSNNFIQSIEDYFSAENFRFSFLNFANEEKMEINFYRSRNFAIFLKAKFLYAKKFYRFISKRFFFFFFLRN